MNHQSYKVILCGDAEVGKSTFISMLMTREFKEKYIPTVGVEVHQIPVNNTRSRVTLNIWDVAGQDKLQGLIGGYFLSSNIVVIMCSATNDSYKNISKWVDMATRLNPHIPIIIVCNKGENTSKTDRETIAHCIQQKYNYPIIFISVKNKINVTKPLLTIIRKLFGDESIEFK